MLGKRTDFAPIDLVGQMGVNFLATHLVTRKMTAANPADADTRIGFKWKDKTGSKSVRSWTDYRFLGGVLAVVAGSYGDETVRRVAYDAGAGLLHSYVATETMLAGTMKAARIAQEFGMRAQGAHAASPAQLPTASTAVESVPAGQPEMVGLGW